MVRATKWIFFGYIVIGILVTRTQTAEENYNGLPNVMITDSESLKRFEVGQSSDFSSNISPTPTVIQQESNLFIKPMINLSSPFTSFKQGYNPAQPVYFTSKVTGEETNIVVGKSELPQVATVAVPPLMIVPTSVHDGISILPLRIPSQPHIPFITSNLCPPSMPCPPNILPVSPNFPHLSRFPIFVEKTVRPIVIPKPPELPPIVLPKLPIQVTVQRPFVPIIDHSVIVQSLCPPQIRCIPTEKELPSVPNVFSGIFQNFKNLLGKTDLTSNFQLDEQSTPERPVAYPLFPTLYAQGIITERFVPNIVKKDDVKIFISPISTTQLANFDYNKK